MNLTELLTAIATSIRNKKGTTEKINAQNFPSEIDSIVLGSGDAEPTDVLVGKTFSNDNGSQTGTMGIYSGNYIISDVLNLSQTYKVTQEDNNLTIE